jgi:hypothetical protein
MIFTVLEGIGTYLFNFIVASFLPDHHPFAPSRTGEELPLEMAFAVLGR